MDKDKNIFETAAKKLGRKDKKPEPKEKKNVEPPPTRAYRDPQVDAMMQQIREMNQDLKSQMESISKKTGLSYDELKKLVDNPKNFSPADWAFLQKNKQLLGDKVWGVVGIPNKPKAKQRENVAGERKAKTLGARKKWIPMR